MYVRLELDFIKDTFPPFEIDRTQLPNSLGCVRNKQWIMVYYVWLLVSNGLATGQKYFRNQQFVVWVNVTSTYTAVVGMCGRHNGSRKEGERNVMR